MKLFSCIVVGALGMSLTMVPAFAAEDMATAKGCFACHDAKVKKVGPAYKDIAEKYKDQKEKVVDELTQKVIKGGKGVYGPVPMPPNPKVNEEEAKKLVTWILGLK